MKLYRGHSDLIPVFAGLLDEYNGSTLSVEVDLLFVSIEVCERASGKGLPMFQSAHSED